MTRIRCAFFLIITLALTSVAAQVAAAQDTDFFVYIGTYTGFKYVHHSKTYGRGESRSKGIYVSRFNAATGELSPAQLAGEIINPSFLTISPNHRFLYAVSEDPLSVGPPLDHASYVSAFAIDSATGKLRLLNTVPSGGTSTCFISMDKTGKYVLMANFGSGSVSVVQVKEDGSLGNLVSFIQNVGHSVNPAIQMEPHPHSILVSPDNRYAIVSDLGTDKVLIFRFDAATGMLSPPDPPSASVYPGGGPRHFTFDPAGKFGYQLSEMSGVVDVFAWDASKGSLTGIQRAQTMPHDFLGINHSAEIEIHPSGKFLYESNRRTMSETEGAPDTIGVFSIDAKGILAPVEQSLTGGVMPRSFALDPTGKYLLAANQVSNNVVVYAIDGATGRLTNSGKEIMVDTPVCLKFVPVGR
jgi:6-phosphogluconolactonase